MVIEHIDILGIEVVLGNSNNESLCVSDYATAAARRLLTNLDIDASQISFLVLCTQTPDYRSPATAFFIQNNLGVGRDCVVVDINSSGTALVTGISILGSMLAESTGGYGILLIGDTLSKQMPGKESNYFGLPVGDGAAAILLRKQESKDSIITESFCCSERYDSIIIPRGAFRNQDPVFFEEDKNLDLTEDHFLRIDERSALGWSSSLSSNPDILNKLISCLRESEPTAVVYNLPAKYWNPGLLQNSEPIRRLYPRECYWGACTPLAVLISELSNSNGLTNCAFICAGEGLSIGFTNLYLDLSHCHITLHSENSGCSLIPGKE